MQLLQSIVNTTQKCRSLALFALVAAKLALVTSEARAVPRRSCTSSKVFIHLQHRCPVFQSGVQCKNCTPKISTQRTRQYNNGGKQPRVYHWFGLKTFWFRNIRKYLEIFGTVKKHFSVLLACLLSIPITLLLPPAPLANSRVSARQSPGWGEGDGRQVTVSWGGGGIARVFQGKLRYPPLMQAKRTRVKRLSR